MAVPGKMNASHRGGVGFEHLGLPFTATCKKTHGSRFEKLHWHPERVGKKT